MNVKDVYYLSKNGNLYTNYQMQTVFEIMTGKQYKYAEGAYLRWLKEQFGKTIKRYVVDPSVEYLFRHGRKANAVIKYSRDHGCSVSEARTCVLDQQMFE